jgi:hypothetical protein
MGSSDGITSAFSIKPLLITPATVKGLPSSVMFLPTIAGSELK